MPAKRRYRLSLATLLAVFALMTTGTLILGKSVPRFAPTTANLAAQFPGPAERRVLLDGSTPVTSLEGVQFARDRITVSRDQIGTSWAEVRYPLPQNPAMRSGSFLTSGVMSSRDVAIGQEDWHVALFGVFFYDANGQRVPEYGVTVQALAGTSVPLRHERLFDVPNSAVEFGVLLRIFNTTGSASISEIEAAMVRSSQLFKPVVLAIAASWALFVVAVLFALYERRCIVLASVPLALIVTILVGIALPDQHLSAIVLPMYSVLEQLPISSLPLHYTSLTKLGHAVAFCALTFFILAARRRLRASFFGIALFLVILAIATESGQLFLTGRDGRLLDIGIDLAGAAAGAVVFMVFSALLWTFRRRRRRLD